jgi:hypothetical protein
VSLLRLRGLCVRFWEHWGQLESSQLVTGLAAASLRNQLSALREFNAESMTRRYKLDLGKSVERALALRLQGFSNVERLERVEAGVYDTSQVSCTEMLL